MFALKAQTIAAQSDKRQRQFDKSIDDWKRKVTDLQAELEQSQRESRDHAAEVYRQRTQMDDNNDVIESLKRENKNLAGTQLQTLRSQQCSAIST